MKIFRMGIILTIGSLFLFGQDDDLLKMSLQELLSLDIEVEVASKNAEKVWDAPGVVSVLNANEIKQFGAKNLVDLLNRLTSVYMLNSYYAPNNFASFRGDSQSNYDNHVLILLNGRPLRESQTSSFNTIIYQAFPISTLNRIEVIRGPGSSLYGASAFSGVINLVTRGNSNGTHAAFNAGSYDSQSGRVNHNGSWKGFDYLLSAGILAEDGWDFKAVDEEGIPQSFKYEDDQTTFLADLTNGQWSFTSLAIRDTYSYWGSTPNGSGAEREHVRYFGNLGWKKEIGHITTEANLTYNRMELRGGAENNAEDFLFEVTTFFQWGPNANIVLGALANKTSGVWGTFIPAYKKTGYSAYLQGDFQVSERVKLIAGGQLNKPDSQDSDFVPRIGLIGYFTPKTGIKLLYGEAFRSPAAIETDFNVPPILAGNPDLLPETVATSEIQLFHEGTNYQVAATGFLSKQESLIARRFTPQGESLFTYQNEGIGEFIGFEFEGKYAPTDRLYTLFSATYQENENDSKIKGFTTLPSFMAKVGVVRRFGESVNLGIFDSYFGAAKGVITTNPNVIEANPPADAFHLLSANLAWTFQKTKKMGQFEFELFGQNLLDEDIYQPELVRRRINTLPAYSGRSVYIKIGWKL